MNDLLTSRDFMCREELSDECNSILRKARNIELLANTIEDMPADFTPKCVSLLARATEMLTVATMALESKMKK